MMFIFPQDLLVLRNLRAVRCRLGELVACGLVFAMRGLCAVGDALRCRRGGLVSCAARCADWLQVRGARIGCMRADCLHSRAVPCF